MADRVDKNWQKSGLTSYSTEAILGTLAHYGAQVDESKFKELAKAAYPLGIASRWHEAGWKGTGQFAKYPFAAAQELWKRWLSDRILPSQFGEALGKLIVSLTGLLANRADANVGGAFRDFEAIKPRIPVKDGGAEEAFVEEGMALLGEDMIRVFDELAERLAQGGHVEDAKQFAQIEEFLVPTRAGVVTAIVRAAAGERDAALADLDKISTDGSRDGFVRLSAIDGLIHLGSEKARTAAEALLDEAEKKEDHHLAMGTIDRLAHVLGKTSDAKAMRALAERAEKIHEAHAKAHPHHHH